MGSLHGEGVSNDRILNYMCIYRQMLNSWIKPVDCPADWSDCAGTWLEGLQWQRELWSSWDRDGSGLMRMQLGEQWCAARQWMRGDDRL